MEENEFGGNENMPEENKNHNWIKYALYLILAGFCVPVMALIYNSVPKFLITAAVIVLSALIVKALCERDKSIAIMRAADPQKTQTCSDIKSLIFDLSGGTFVINKGINFSVNGTDEKHFKSYIKNGVWHFESANKTKKHNSSADAYPVTISVPQNFNAEKASVNLTGGKLLIQGISAYKMSLNNESGDMDIRNMYAQNLEIRCAIGAARANVMTNGDINLICSRGKIGLNLNCYPDSLNLIANAKNSRVSIGDRIVEDGSMFVDNQCARKLNVNCENGETFVTFRQEAVNND